LTKQIKISDYLVSVLQEQGIVKIFGYIGGSITHLYDSISKNKDIELINMIHEQGAGFAAEAMSRVSGTTSVALATSGPGATNLITAIGSSFFDSVPVLFITGQVNTYEYKYNRPLRQLGFQETDIVQIVKPITKYSVMIEDASRIRYELEKALFLTQQGRKGPVVLDIPMNIQREMVSPEKLPSFFSSDEYLRYGEIEKESISHCMDEIQELLSHSKRPVVLVGGGVRISGAVELLKSFLTKHHIPVVYSLLGKDAIESNYEYNLGLIGSYGNRYGNFTLANADLVLVLGARLDTRQTGTEVSTFCRGAKIIQVDIDKDVLSSIVQADIEVNQDLQMFLSLLSAIHWDSDISDWQRKTLHYKETFMELNYSPEILKPHSIISSISNHLVDSDIICSDVGQNQMWVAQFLSIKGAQRLLFSGGMGAMGFALPASIGVAVSGQERAIVIVGDGGMQMNIQELQVIRRRNLNVIVFVINNHALGMVRQFQELYFNSNYIGTITDYDAPDFVAIAKAYGLRAYSVMNEQELNDLFEQGYLKTGPCLVNINMQTKITQVSPKLVVGHPIEDMHPFIPEELFSQEMLL